jgi:hypothetical protein
MTIVEIKDCVRKDVPIYYRREFSGVAVIEAAGKKQDIHVDWTIESSPLGTSEISVSILQPVDYPLVPLIKELKNAIEALDHKGQLPL